MRAFRKVNTIILTFGMMMLVTIMAVFMHVMPILGAGEFDLIDADGYEVYNKAVSLEGVTPTSDGGYIVVGEASGEGEMFQQTPVNQNWGWVGGSDAIAVKFNADGSLGWAKNYGGPDTEVFHTIVETSDGGYLAVGVSKGVSTNLSPQTLNWDHVGDQTCDNIIIVKLDANGDVIWTKNYGGEIPNKIAKITSTIETSDGSFLLAGYTNIVSTNLPSTQNWSNEGEYDALAMKISANGEVLWAQNYGGTSVDYFEGVVEFSSDVYLVVGWTRGASTNLSTNPTDLNWSLIGGNDVADALLVKIDASTGAATWAQTYGGTGRDEWYSIAKTSDGGYIVSGMSADVSTSFAAGSNWGHLGSVGSGDAVVVKFNADGSVAWAKNYGGTDYEAFRSIMEVSGGYVAAGFSTGASTSFPTDQNWSNVTLDDAIIARIDASGNGVLSGNYGGSGTDSFHTIIQTTLGEYVVIGGSDSSSTNLSGGMNWEIHGGKYSIGAIILRFRGQEKVDITGTKVWVGGPSAKPTIQLQLYQNDVAYGSPVTLVSGTTTYTWTNLDKNDTSGLSYVYTVKEVNVPDGYDKTSESGLTVTNTFKTPTIGTSASDKDTGTRESYADSSVTIVDTVTYTNLIIGKEYKLVGVLMDKSTTSPIEINGSPVTLTYRFTPTVSNGTVVIEFEFNGSFIAGKTVVVYERLYDLSDELIASHEDIDDMNQTITFPSVSTNANDKESQTRTAEADSSVTIVDTVSYTNLVVGQSYTLTGILMDKDTELPLYIGGNEVTITKQFTPSVATGTETLEFPFDATGLEGKRVVVFEKLYDVNGKLVGGHEDINDSNQTITFPSPRISIGTMATDKVTGTHESFANGIVTITDTVSYNNLTVGEQYTLKGKLMDKDTELPLYIGGNEVTATKQFTPSVATGTETLEFSFDATGLDGKTVVVFEELLYEGIVVASHENINDAGQTISFPALGTTATDKNTETHESYADAVNLTTIVDVVAYTNLTPGAEYEVNGKLVDKKSGSPIIVGGVEVVASKKFVPSQPNGSITLEFEFDASDYAGETLVVFERLYDSSGNLVGSHEKIDDEGQTIRFPSVATSARDKKTGKQVAAAEGPITIVDSVTYTNLTVGKEYTLSGVLMDKDTNSPLEIGGLQITASVTFTPSQPNGTESLEFYFNAIGLDGKTIVVFEKLYDANGNLVGSHEDINDRNQTVAFTKVPPSTGIHDSSVLYVGILAVSLGAVVALNDKKKRKAK